MQSDPTTPPAGQIKICPACASEIAENENICPICGYVFADKHGRGGIIRQSRFLILIAVIAFILAQLYVAFR